MTVAETEMVRSENLPLALETHQIGMTAALHTELEKVRTASEISGLVANMLSRHASGDWGEVCAHDAKVNDEALKYKARILSAYTIEGIKVWVMTDAGWNGSHRVTTIMRPEDY